MHSAAPATPQCVQGMKNASLGEGSQASSAEPWMSPLARTPERPGAAQLHVCQWQGTMGDRGKFMRRGVCLLSSKCGAADTVDLSSFIPPLICVPAPRCGRLITDRKGRETLQLPPMHSGGGNGSSPDPSSTASPAEIAPAVQLPILLRDARFLSSCGRPQGRQSSWVLPVIHE